MDINNILKVYNDCYLLASDNYIVEAGCDFFRLTGYSRNDIIGKHFKEVCRLLRLDIDNIPNIDINNKYYIYTKDIKIKEMRILEERTVFQNMKIFYFIDFKKDNNEYSDDNLFLKNEGQAFKVTNIKNSDNDIFDKIDLPVFIVSYPDFKILNFNKKALNFIKFYKERDIRIVKLFPDFFSESNIKLIEEMRETKDLVYSRKNKLVYNDNIMYFNYIYHPLTSMDNGTEQFVFILEDVTEEEIEKAKIENAAKLQEEFFSFITHEFRTPLNTICSTLQLLELVYNSEITDNIKRYMSTIKRNTYQQLRLVNNLLDITKAESGYLVLHKKYQDIVLLTRAISDSVKNFAEARNIRVKFCTKLEQKYTAIDDEKYERIILNLLSNAIKFTPQNKNIYVTLSSNDKKIIICVRDEGIGIPQDEQQTVFGKFRQVGNKLVKSSEGSGIGLYLVKLLVEEMDGTIDVISKENKGSSFVLKLPEEIDESQEISSCRKLIDNHIVQSMQMEFSSIYSI